jgi:hypothetical protein
MAWYFVKIGSVGPVWPYTYLQVILQLYLTFMKITSNRAS